MDYPPNVWRQLKAKACDDLIRALEKDGWLYEGARGAVHAYRHPDGRPITIHRHPSGDGYRPNLLKALLDDIGWSVEDMIALKLIKRG
jgi:predicted RNA binding protein YcfA (HicA-like mRNA interferase family)